MRYIALDTETNGKDVRYDPGFKMLGWSTAYRKGTGDIQTSYIPVGHLSDNDPEPEIRMLELRKELLSPENVFVFHNAKFDLKVLERSGLPEPKNWYCTMLMVHWINENLPNKSLDYVASKYLGETKVHDPRMEAFIKGPGWGFIPVWLMRPYAEKDPKLTLEIFELIYPDFTAQGFDGDLWNYERRFVRAINAMESNGVSIDEELSRQEISLGQNRMAEIVELLDGLKPSSPKDLEKLILERLQLPVVKRSKKTGKPSFDKKAMEEYEAILSHRNDPTASLILEYRGWQKAISTYFTAFIEKRCKDQKIRPNFKLHGTKTSRLSCESPNFQQIPKVRDETKKRWSARTKKAIVPTQGFKLWEFDYSNLELRMAAVYSQEPEMIRWFREGENIWQMFIDRLGWDKDTVKTFTYSVLYGAGNQRLMNVFGVDFLGARKLKDDYFKPFPKLKWVSDPKDGGYKQQADQQGYVSLWTGRRRHFEYFDEHRKAFNAILQGGGAEIVKRALIRCWEEVCDPDCKLVLTVHDSIVFEIKENKEHLYISKIKEIMEDVPEDFKSYRVPFPVDCHVWGEG